MINSEMEIRAMKNQIAQIWSHLFGVDEGTDSGGETGRWFVITGATEVETGFGVRPDYRANRYSMIERKKIAPGYGSGAYALSGADPTWDTVENGVSTQLGYNGFEVPWGGTSGNTVMTTGVDRENLTGTFDYVPLGVGAIVRAWPVTFVYEDETITEWWFYAPTQVDGTCEEP